MVSSFYYNGDIYARRTEADQYKGFLMASVLSGAAYKSLGLFGIPFDRQLRKELPNNENYKKYLDKALELSDLKNKGVKIVEAQFDSSIPNDFRLGKNACYNTVTRQVILNTDKIAISAFHELGHAKNYLGKGFPKLLKNMKVPGYAIAGLMEYFAIFSRTKPKDAPRNFTDIVEDNCGKIAFCAMLPMVAEEALASHRGIKLAKTAGLKKLFIQNMKKLYSKALLTYVGRAAVGGLAVWSSRKIMDYYTRPQKIDSDIYNLFG